MTRKLTDADLLDLYVAMGCELGDTHDREVVAAEMLRVLAARTIEQAAGEIEWWGGWGNYQSRESAYQWARDYRRMARERAAG